MKVELTKTKETLTEAQEDIATNLAQLDENVAMYHQKEKELAQAKTDVDRLSKAISDAETAVLEEKQLHIQQIAQLEATIKVQQAELQEASVKLED